MKKKTEAPLVPVETLAEAAKLPAWELAALRQAANWAEGKHVTQAELDAALTRLRNRPQGGGTI
jgi:hypothetical protein